MRLLIDTHLLIWAAEGLNRVPERARTLMADPGNDAIFSAASIWEAGIKYALGRPDFVIEPALLRSALLRAGYVEMPVDSEHGIRAAGLPMLHRDPFDRMLVAQAMTEDLLLLTADKMVAQYGNPVVLV